mgnify:CR=1 FL=1
MNETPVRTVPAAVTFDAAGTLIRPRLPVGVIYSEVARRYGASCEAAELERRFWRAFRAAPPLCFPRAAEEEREARERQWWEQIVRQVFEGCAPSDFSAFFSELYATFARPETWAVFPDVLPAFSGLRARGVRLGVVSNFDGRLEGILTGLRLRLWLDVVVTSSQAGAAKPSPEIFHVAARKLALPPERLWHVGDDRVEDVAGAEAAGLRAFLIDRGGCAGAGCLTDLRELLALLNPDGTCGPTFG